MTNLGYIGFLSFILHDFIVLSLIPIVLLSRKPSQSKLAWIFAIILMPFVGAIVFLAFGHNRLQRKQVEPGRRKAHMRANIAFDWVYDEERISFTGAEKIHQLLTAINPFPPTVGNSVVVYEDMQRNFDEQIAAISNAQQFVHLAYYIFQDDKLGERFRRSLIDAAKRGVVVRVLYDSIGSIGLTNKFLEPLRNSGVHVNDFLPIKLLTRRWVFNFRNHRKILVCDGNVAFVGGANIGVEYLGQSHMGKWLDTHLMIKGPAVNHIQQVFLEDWAYAGGKEITQEEKIYRAKPAGDVVAQVVPGGPDQEPPVYEQLYFCAISNAEKKVRIMSPYLVPDEALLTAMQSAVTRGVDVRILTTGPRDHALVKLASRACYLDLLEAGVKIYETRYAFLHSKVMTIDDHWSIVGTANVDNRSMRLNFEIGVGLHDARLTAALNQQFDSLVNESIEITVEARRNRHWWFRTIENFARLFAPIL